MIHLFEASTLYQVASLNAMLGSGALGERREGEERVLVLINSARQPELVPSLQETPGFERLAAAFDRIIDFGAQLWPRRPHQFNPRTEELPLWQSLLRTQWGLGTEPVRLYLESLQANPAKALARVFGSSPLVVHSDGLMSYGPTRVTLPRDILQRVDAVAYLDLLPGLRPILLRETGAQLIPVPASALGELIADWARAERPSEQAAAVANTPDRVALLLGQYLADLGIVTPEQERDLAAAMLHEAKAAGASVVAYKPHPSASLTSLQAVLEAARAAGVDAVILPDTVPAEVVAEWVDPAVVVSAFSTGLMTLRATRGVLAVAVGTEELMPLLSPYQNSNRVPLILADALLRPGSDPRLAQDPALLQGLMEAVAYAMRSTLLPELRQPAQDFLTRHPDLRDRYVKQRRLRVLGLPHRVGRAPSRAHRLAQWILRDPELARRTLGTLGRLRTPGGLRGGPRRAAGAVGSRLVTWSKRG
jgi:hypothetical protein